MSDKSIFQRDYEPMIRLLPVQFSQNKHLPVKNSFCKLLLHVKQTQNRNVITRTTKMTMNIAVILHAVSQYNEWGKISRNRYMFAVGQMLFIIYYFFSRLLSCQPTIDHILMNDRAYTQRDSHTWKYWFTFLSRKSFILSWIACSQYTNIKYSDWIYKSMI